MGRHESPELILLYFLSYFLDANNEGEQACPFSFYVSVQKEIVSLGFNNEAINTSMGKYCLTENGAAMTFSPSKPGTTSGLTSQIDDTSFSRLIAMTCSEETITFDVLNINFESYQVYQLETENGLYVGNELQDLTGIEVSNYQGIIIINTEGLPQSEYTGTLLSDLGLDFDKVVVIYYLKA